MDIIIGVDEVGRGCLCGSVVCCAYTKIQNSNNIDKVTDSKKLSFKTRTELEKQIKVGGYYSIHEIDEVCIDKINILNATLMCMRICVIELIKKLINKNLITNNIIVYIDGNHNPFKL